MNRPNAIALLLALALLLTACAPQPPGPAADSSTSPSSAPTASVPPPAADGSSVAGVPVAFQTPAEPFTVLGGIPRPGGRLLLYEEAHPEEYNRQFSQTDTFYTLRVQLFDEKGGYERTVESDWGNCYHQPPPAYDLRLEGETLHFEIDSEDAQGRRMTRQFTFSLTDGAYDLHDLNEIPQTSRPDLVLQTDHEGDFFLTDPERRRLAVTVDGPDSSLVGAIYEASMGSEDWLNDPTLVTRQLAVEVGANGSAARLSNTKTTLTLDFATGSVTQTRVYPPALLGDEMARSPSGNRRVLQADHRDAFESPGLCDFVLVNGQSEPRFLFYNSDITQVHFVGEELIWANTYGEMLLFDAATGEKADLALDFDFLRDAEGRSGRMVIGTAYDTQHKLLLAAWRENPKEYADLLPVRLSVFDSTGLLLRELETGLTIIPYGKFSIMPVELALSNGAVRLTGVTGYDEAHPDGKSSVTVAYR